MVIICRKEGEFLYQNVQTRFRAAAENWAHDPPSAGSDALTTELLGLYGEQGRNSIIITPATEEWIGDLLEVGRPPVHKAKTLQYHYVMLLLW